MEAKDKAGTFSADFWLNEEFQNCFGNLLRRFPKKSVLTPPSRKKVPSKRERRTAFHPDENGNNDS